MTSRPWILVLACAVLAVLSGCSFVLTNEPSYLPGEPPRCESTLVAPAIDVIGAIASVALASAIALQIRAEDGPRLRSAAVAGTGVGLGAMYTFAAVTGVGRSRRCRSAIAAWHATHP